jgi:hypothetical protein
VSATPKEIIAGIMDRIVDRPGHNMLAHEVVNKLDAGGYVIVPKESTKAHQFRAPTPFGLAIEVSECLPRNGFMMVSRLNCEPAVYHVIRSEGGELKEWRGTLEEAYAALASDGGAVS